MAAQMNISQDDATKRFNDLQNKATNAKQQAVQTAQSVAAKTAHVTSAAAFLAFGVLLLGAISSAIGGSIAAPRKILVADTGTRSEI
jgi:Mn2+/Fe2+ NRAMP family transporter